MAVLNYSQQNLDKLLKGIDPSGGACSVYHAATEFSQMYIAPFDRQMCDDRKIKSDLWAQMGKQDLLGMMIPEQYGGAGLGYLHLVTALSAISYASGSVALSALAHSVLCTDRINHSGNDKQKEQYLPDLVSGEKIGALAMTEPNAGSDVLGSMRTMAKKVDGGWVINGEKTFITNANIADTIVLYAKTGTPDSKIATAFILEKDTQGLSHNIDMHKIGMKASQTGSLYLTDCFVPDEQVLGEVNTGGHILMNGLNPERLALSAIADGLIRHAFDETRDHLLSRKQFGKEIYHFQGVQFQMADMFVAIDSFQENLFNKANRADFAKDDTMTNALMASLFLNASESCEFVTTEAIKLCGGMGYTEDFAVGRCNADGKLLATGGGSENMRRILIGRDIFAP